MDVSKLTDLELATHLNIARKELSNWLYNVQMLEAELNKRLSKTKVEPANQAQEA